MQIIALNHFGLGHYSSPGIIYNFKCSIIPPIYLPFKSLYGKKKSIYDLQNVSFLTFLTVGKTYLQNTY